MAKPKGVVEEMNAALAADKVSLPETNSDYLETLSFDELTALRDRVNVRIDAIKHKEIEALDKQIALLNEKRAKLGGTVPVNAPKGRGGPKGSRGPRTPPEGAKIYTHPEDSSKTWWEGKSKRPNWLPAE